VPGSLGQFVVGNSRNTGDGIGHMAGTLLGVNVESAGGVGVRVGSSARGASSSLFGEHYAFKFHNGGIVPNFGMSDVPALLAPGETVRTRQQEAALGMAPPNVVVKFYVDGQEFRGMTRTEIDNALGDVHDRALYAGGGN
jgi:hypothetical protein